MPPRDDIPTADDIRDPEVAERFACLHPDAYLRRREFLARTAMTGGLAATLAGVLSPDRILAAAAKRQKRVRLPQPAQMPVDTFVVLMMENRSFDHYMGWLPGADGRQAGLRFVDREGISRPTRYMGQDFQGCAFNDPDHGWDDGRTHLAGGRMNGFLRSPDSDLFAVSYYNEADLPFLPAAARAFTTYDRMFCSALASTFPNRYYMHAATSYGQKSNTFPNQAGYPDGFPDETTIWAALERIGVSTRYFYSDIPVSALWGERGLARSAEIPEYYERCRTGTLPSLSFVDPSFVNEGGGTSGDEHPHGDIRVGQAFMADIVEAFMESPQWSRGALFVVYDEWGGFFDHVRPPRVPDERNARQLSEDFGQLGIRIPSVAISPYARKGFVAHDVYSPVSILKMISYRFGLPPLNRRLAYASNIARSFDWASPPRLDLPPLPDPPAVAGASCPNRPFSTLSKGPHTARPKEHDLAVMKDSGYLEGLGFDFRPASADMQFRMPHSTIGAHEAAVARAAP